jgi:hypothetical protein
MVTPEALPRAGRLWGAIGLLLMAAPVGAQMFFPDDPLWRDRDDLEIAQPGEIELSGGWDMIENTFGIGRPHAEPDSPAVNVNTLGEVPDSSWFTNRMGRRVLSLEELRRGPSTRGGPVAPWTVVRGKSSGITPGFTIRDAGGDIYFIKFDPADYPNLPSAADVIGTTFFHAIGYNVPENYIARLRPEELELSPTATISGGGRKDAPMTEADLQKILNTARPREDGSYRVVASLAVPGTPLGPRKFFGTRPDDPNDVFPHEDRRELRGYRVFCAWLNHDDSRAVNTLDVFVGRGDRGFVRHYLIDFASILGSGSVRPQGLRAGNEYLLEWGPAIRSALTLGWWDRAWRSVEYPDYPEVGRFESDFFEPQAWRPEHPNLAFQKMRNDDAFWAARIVSRFDDEAIAAAVSTGQYDDPEAERYVVKTLIARRDKIVAEYFTRLNPLDEFRVEASLDGPGRLVFENLGVRAGLGEADGYEVAWFELDNESGRLSELSAPAQITDPSIAVPESDAEFLVVRIGTRSDVPGWVKSVHVYLRNDVWPKSVVGIERES